MREMQEDERRQRKIGERGREADGERERGVGGNDMIIIHTW